MSQEKNKINCPDCGTQIDVNEILHAQVHEQLERKYSEKLAAEKARSTAEALALKEGREQLESDRRQQDDEIAKKVEETLKNKELVLTKQLKAQAEEEQSAAVGLMQKELIEKSDKIKELNKASAELEKIKREKDELESSIKAEAAKELDKQLSEATKRIQKEEDDKNELRFKTLTKQLEDQKKLAEEMKRKHEQGSMQTQGEVQELAIEEWLGAKFPLDTIQEIKKGERGADCLQIVNTRTRQNCGSIYYESKRTKTFNPNWIEKFKSDIREKNADSGVLVTEVMPSDMDRFGLKDGVWVCSFDEFKGLCTVLRESVIHVSTAVITQENKGDKMGMLYDFLASNEFKLQIEAIVEGFSQMQSDLESEQRSMRAIWKKREKQIEKVTLNTTSMYGAIKGIAGSAIQSVPLLELPSGGEPEAEL